MKARPSVRLDDRQQLAEVAWTRVWAQVRQLSTIVRGQEPQPLALDSELLLAQMIAAMSEPE